MKSEDDVEIAPGVVGPRTVSNELLMPQPGDGTFALQFRASFNDSTRRYECDEIRLRRESGSSPITTDVLRQFAIGDIVQGFLRVLLLLDTSSDAVQTGPVQYIRDLPNPGNREPWGRQTPTDLDGEGGSDRALSWVAHWYRIGAAIGDSPTKTVQEQLGLTRTTAIRRVMAARDRGFLGMAEVGKAGERKA
jgi:hypothetical protein